jgi:uncharacterized metal-binding protein
VGKDIAVQCARCEIKECRAGRDCFSKSDSFRKLYDDAGIAGLHKAASAIEARHYGKQTRLGETIKLAAELGCGKVGLAFCIGLAAEAKIIDDILSSHFDVISVCCKVCGLKKQEFSLERVSSNDEVMCNPAGQAQLLNEAGTGLNILCGLCVGHDAVFAKISEAPVTTLIAKDRVLAHNPAGAVYSRYVRKTLQNETG